VRNRILQPGLDTSHMERPPRSPKWDADPATRRTSSGTRSWTDEDLRAAVAASRSLRGVLVHLNLKVGGGQYVALRRHIARRGLSTEHFTGQGWTGGMTAPVPRAVRPLEEILVKDSEYTKGASLKRRLIACGLLQPVCAGCGREEWRGEPMPLQLDHINGDRRDNPLENLRLLCPNCHALTDTWCRRNKDRYD
jgi:hypothetical protein